MKNQVEFKAESVKRAGATVIKEMMTDMADMLLRNFYFKIGVYKKGKL